MAKSKTKKRSPLAAYLREPSLFDDGESTFVDTHARKRVYVHLTPAPWSRVLLLSLVYALAINFVKLGWFEYFGKPQLYAVEAETADNSAPPAEETEDKDLGKPSKS